MIPSRMARTAFPDAWPGFALGTVSGMTGKLQHLWSCGTYLRSRPKQTDQLRVHTLQTIPQIKLFEGTVRPHLFTIASLSTELRSAVCAEGLVPTQTKLSTPGP